MPNDSEEETSITFSQILVAVDTSSHSRAALQAAAILAEKLEGEIHGLFVHEETWQKVSSLPSMTTINELTGSTSALEEQYLEEQVEMLKKRLRRQVKTISRENKISHTWKAVRGRVEEEILQAAKDADLITIGRRGCAFPQKKEIGSTAKSIIQSTDKPVLILKSGLELGRNITAIYDDSKESQRGIKVAMSLAEKFEAGLTILIVRNSSEKVEDQQNELEKLIHKTPVQVEIVFLKNPDLWGFIHSINRRRAGLLIIPKNQSLLQTNLETVLYQLECPLLMMD